MSRMNLECLEDRVTPSSLSDVMTAVVPPVFQAALSREIQDYQNSFFNVVGPDASNIYYLSVDFLKAASSLYSQGYMDKQDIATTLRLWSQINDIQWKANQYLSYPQNSTVALGPTDPPAVDNSTQYGQGDKDGFAAGYNQGYNTSYLAGYQVGYDRMPYPGPSVPPIPSPAAPSSLQDYNQGYNDGFGVGFNQGYNDGYLFGYEAGNDVSPPR